jgi:hypothetical protein
MPLIYFSATAFSTSTSILQYSFIPLSQNIFDLFLDNFNNFLLQVVEVFLFDGEQGPNFRYFRVNQIDDLFLFLFRVGTT